MLFLQTILFSLALLMFILQLSLLKKIWVVGIWVAFVGGFLFLMYPMAIDYGYEELNRAASNRELVSDLLVLQVLEALAGIFLNVYLTQLYYKGRVSPIYRFFKYIPGVIVFPALFYFQILAFLNIGGMRFNILAIVVALAFPAMVLLGRHLARKTVPEYHLRLELKFILHVLQIVVSVILSIRLFVLPVKHVETRFSIAPLLVGLALLGIFMWIGKHYYLYITSKKLKQIEQNS